MKVGCGLVAFGFIVLAAGCGTEVPEADPRRQCELLRAQQVDERLRTVTVDREQHRVAVEAALGDEFMRHCVAELTASSRTAR